MIFLWVLTWYSYWIIMKNQINPTNIIGAAIPASLLILSQFSRVRDAVSKTLKLGTFQTDKNTRSTDLFISSGSRSDENIQISPVTPTSRIQSLCLDPAEKSPQETTVSESTIRIQDPCINQIEKSPQKITEPKTQKQEPKSILLEDKSQQPPSGSNRCPKNLDYFTKKPRPKQAPEECMTCKNLISCVCQSNS